MGTRHVRYWLKKSRPQRQAAAARVVKQMLLDLGNVSEMKDTVKNFMLRTRRLQNTVTVAVMKFHYRCSVLLNQVRAAGWRYRAIKSTSRPRRGFQASISKLKTLLAKHLGGPLLYQLINEPIAGDAR